MQRKLSVGASNDPLEREAERVADHVVTAPCSAGAIPPRLQRYSGRAREEPGAVPVSVDRTLASSGRPLDPPWRHDLEQRFGHDFSGVRLHSDTAAAQSAQEVNAQAYTAGHHIVFGAGRFAPHTDAGHRLLAHELAHVVQQSGTEGSPVGPVSLSPPRLIQRQPEKSPPQKPPADKTLQSTGVDSNDPVATNTATLIDEVLARNKRLAPYIGDRLSGGFKIAEKDKFVQDSSDGNFENAYRGAYGMSASEFVSKDTKGFFDDKKSIVHLRPGATFGTALHESVHRLASPAMYSTYLLEAQKISSNLLEVLKEGVTAFFTDCILRDEKLPNFIDANRTYKGKAEAMIKALGADGFDLIAKFNFQGTGILEIGKKLGYTDKQASAAPAKIIPDVMRLMDQAI